MAGENIHGQHIIQGNTTRWHPIGATQRPDGTWSLQVDTELVVDAANMALTNLKVGSVDQTTGQLRFIKVLDDGTTVTEANPLDSYNVADVDDGNDPISSNYFGYSNKNEEWYILQENKSGTTDTYRYFKGIGSYVTAWNARVSHTYNYFHIIF